MHPVRFTRRQVEFIELVISEFFEYFEEEFSDLLSTIKSAEEGDNHVHKDQED